MAVTKPQVVSAWRQPVQASAEGTANAVAQRATLGPGTDFEALEQTVLECAPGGSQPRATGSDEEVLFVLSGRGSLVLDGVAHALAPETGAYLAPGDDYELRGEPGDPLRLIAVRIPDPDAAAPGAGDAERVVVRALAEQEAQAATGERQFRIVADPSCGLRSATHFVGYIPPGRAPVHFHTYDEVIYVLNGEGVLHAGGASTPIEAGSCIQLPARSLHTLENSGPGEMRLAAVFRPAGSPAAAYYPDGTPAYVTAPPLDPQSSTSVSQQEESR